MIKYLGSKRLLIPTISEIVKALPSVHSIFDIFSGTSRVGHHFKANGYQVTANDLSTFAKVLADCYIAADAGQYAAQAERLIKEYNSSSARTAGYFTQTYCIDSKFFQPKNGERVDWIRNDLESKGLDPLLKAILLTSLMEAADRVDSTCGLQMAYLKSWAPRANQDLTLRLPPLLPGTGATLQLDAKVAAEKVNADLTYVDPPYNQHSYLGNYHIWESLALWDQAEVYGKARKRIDVKTRKSPFNRKKSAFDSLKQVIETIRSKYVLLSFSNEGFITRGELELYLSGLGELVVYSRDFKRYVGAQIGIYNPAGQKVGRVSHLRNEEYLYLLTKGV